MVIFAVLFVIFLLFTLLLHYTNKDIEYDGECEGTFISRHHIEDSGSHEYWIEIVIDGVAKKGVSDIYKKGPKLETGTKVMVKYKDFKNGRVRTDVINDDRFVKYKASLVVPILLTVASFIAFFVTYFK